MKYRCLDTVVLQKDLLAHGLKRGDVGAVVGVYEPDGLQVEFVTAAGETGALVDLKSDDVRPVDKDDLITVRRHRRSA